MEERLEQIVLKYKEINEKLIDPEVARDIKLLTSLSKEQRQLEKIVNAYEKY